MPCTLVFKDPSYTCSAFLLSQMVYAAESRELSSINKGTEKLWTEDRHALPLYAPSLVPKPHQLAHNDDDDAITLLHCVHHRVCPILGGFHVDAYTGKDG